MDDPTANDEPKRKRRRKYHPPVGQEHSLMDVAQEFASEEDRLEYLAALRWPEGVVCLKCDSKRISILAAAGRAAGSPTRHLFQRLDCKHQFTATTGTIFHDTHLSLAKWFQAVALMCEGKKGVSAMQMRRHLDLGSYRTAWYLNHRIRKAMEEGPENRPQMAGVVEADETYIGGKYDRRRKRERWDKEPVFGILQRNGEVRTWHVPNVNRWFVIDKLKDNISIEADLVRTDDGHIYDRMPIDTKHEIVNHSAKEWVRGDGSHRDDRRLLGAAEARDHRLLPQGEREAPAPVPERIRVPLEQPQEPTRVRAHHARLADTGSARIRRAHREEAASCARAA